MSKFFKIFFVLISIITIFSCVSNAETTNLYNEVSNNKTSESLIDSENDLDDDTENTSAKTTSSTSTYTPSQSSVSSISSISEANLGLNNILCVILIALCILLILLAIAILIRLKHA